MEALCFERQNLCQGKGTGRVDAVSCVCERDRGESSFVRDTVLERMEELREGCDEAETLTAKKYWPYPSYGDLLFSVN